MYKMELKVFEWKEIVDVLNLKQVKFFIQTNSIEQKLAIVLYLQF